MTCSQELFKRFRKITSSIFSVDLD